MTNIFIGSVNFSKIVLDKVRDKMDYVLCPYKTGNEDYCDLGGDLFHSVRDTIPFIEMVKPDYIFVIGLSEIVPKEILKFKVIGSHPTLLPKMRGCSPLVWTHILNMKSSGATLFWMDEGIDTGDIWKQKEFEVPEKYNELYERAASITAEMLKDGINELEKGIETRVKQDNTKATYLKKRKREEWITL